MLNHFLIVTDIAYHSMSCEKMIPSLLLFLQVLYFVNTSKVYTDIKRKYRVHDQIDLLVLQEDMHGLNVKPRVHKRYKCGMCIFTC